MCVCVGKIYAKIAIKYFNASWRQNSEPLCSYCPPFVSFEAASVYARSDFISLIVFEYDVGFIEGAEGPGQLTTNTAAAAATLSLLTAATTTAQATKIEPKRCEK